MSLLAVALGSVLLVVEVIRGGLANERGQKRWPHLICVVVAYVGMILGLVSFSAEDAESARLDVNDWRVIMVESEP